MGLKRPSDAQGFAAFNVSGMGEGVGVGEEGVGAGAGVGEAPGMGVGGVGAVPGVEAVTVGLGAITSVTVIGTPISVMA